MLIISRCLSIPRLPLRIDQGSSQFASQLPKGLSCHGSSQLRYCLHLLRLASIQPGYSATTTEQLPLKMRVSVLVDSVVYVQGVLFCNDINSMSHPVNQAMLAMPKKPLACPLKFFVTTGIKLEIVQHVLFCRLECIFQLIFLVHEIKNCMNSPRYV